MLSDNLKNQKRKEDFFSEWERRRIVQLSEQLDKLDEHKSLFLQEDALYMQLMKALPEELGQLLVKYNHTLNLIMATRQNFFYRNGFLDCFSCLKLFDSSIGERRF